ncbi:MAG: hypothetical protein AAF652_05010 [Cyanobacteria bacterium P01_C01_bin.72]
MKRQPSQETTFFRLTPGVRDRLLEINLTAAEWRIWCYLVSLDPFGDRGAKFLPAELMLKCKIKKTTYFSAKAKFQKLGLFDFRDGVTKVVNLQTSLISKASDYSQQASTIESEISESEFGNSESQSEISESEFGNSESQSEISESEFGNSESRRLKPLPSKVSKSLQTLQTYTDFKKTLSEGERENFFNFVRKKTENLEKPINDLEAWLASKTKAKENRWEIYYRNYQEEKISESKKPTRQGNKLGTLNPSQVQRAIAEFQKQRGINQPVDEPEPKEVNSEEYQQKEAEFNRLLDNPPERELRKSPAQQRREAISEARRKQEEWNLERKKLDAERQRKQELDEPDPEARTARMIREAEEFLRNRQQENPEIGEEGLENE